MITFALRRLLWGAAAMFVVGTLTFALLFMSGQEAARTLMGENATAEQVAAKATELGLDRPFLEQLLGWWGGALRLDFGRSWFSNQPVVEAIGQRLPVTLVMVFVSITLITALAIALGVLAAVRRGLADRIVQILSVVASAIPGFVVGIFLVMLFAIKLGWFPAISTISPTAPASAWVASLVLPVVALVLHGFAGAAQQVRSAFLKQLEQDYVRTLRSRGIPEREVLLRHVLRAAAPAALTVLSMQFIGLMGGTVIIENLFAIAGMGRLAVDATTRSDLPLVMGVVVYTVAIVVVVNLLVDVANGWLNPKVRVS